MWRGLSQGVAPWRYEALLKRVMSPEIVSAVSWRMQRFNPLPGKIFHVKVGARADGDYVVDVKHLRTEY